MIIALMNAMFKHQQLWIRLSYGSLRAIAAQSSLGFGSGVLRKKEGGRESRAPAALFLVLAV